MAALKEHESSFEQPQSNTTEAELVTDNNLIRQKQELANKQTEMKERIQSWIENFVAANPEGFNSEDNLYTFAVIPRKDFKLDLSNEDYFPALSASPPKVSTPAKNGSKSTRSSKPPTKKSTSAKPVEVKKKIAKESFNETVVKVDDKKDFPELSTPPKNSTSPPVVALSYANVVIQQTSAETTTPNKSWKECRYDECYEEHKEEYRKHRVECEDCLEEYFNHELFDGESEAYWARVE